jgi:hypothetical protein
MENPDALFREIHRILQPDGTVPPQQSSQVSP